MNLSGIQPIIPMVIRCWTLSLVLTSGIKIILVSLFPYPFTVSKYLICIAAFEFSSSAACLISLALYTSALAEIIFACAILRSLAALDNESCKSRLNCISLIKISSTYN